MEEELKEKIINTIRKEHNITIKTDDPLFAIVTANELMLEEQLKQLNNIFADQLIETELATQNYLNKAKRILEEKLTYLLKEVQTEHKSSTKEEPTQNRNINYKHPLLLTTIGIIIGYTIALFIL